MRLVSFFLLAFSLLLTKQGFGYESLNHSHVHEAFMNNEAPITLLTAVKQSPPAPLNERPTPQTDSQTIWIPGYWEWSNEREEFVWCSGCWRRPPPNHQWIAGQWQQLEEGWVRVKGFWSQIPESGFSYIKKSPPDPYDEHPSNQPNKDYFWMSGYWSYEHGNYIWYTGKWEQLDSNWIYVPAKYIWRQEGYVFVPAFWDWPLDDRGTAYTCLAVPAHQTEIQYLSDMIIEPFDILEGCLLYYPDYYYFYFYYCFFYEEWWWGCNWCPPWWGWADWWWMPWFDHWGLWWWWCNPGFPAPFWFEAAWMEALFGPPMPLINMMKQIHPPLIIGPQELIPPSNLIDATENNQPVFPQDPTDIQTEAGKDVEQGSTKRPSGPKVPHEQIGQYAPPAPQTTPFPPSRAKPGKQPSLPKTPPTVKTPAKPEIPMPSQPPIYQPPQTQVPGYYTPQPPPSYYPPQLPPSQKPLYPPSQRKPSYPRYPKPPSYQPSIPQIKPPSQTQPYHPPQYRPRSPNITPPMQQYTPQSPKTNTSPSQSYRGQKYY